MKLTRRQVAGVLLAAPAAPAQTPDPAQAETPAELLAAARERVRKNAEALAKADLPMGTEPAFSFRAL